jgi:Transposase DDE domain group 1
MRKPARPPLAPADRLHYLSVLVSLDLQDGAGLARTGRTTRKGPAGSTRCTNIPDSGIAGVPGSHHPQYLGTVHREHAVVETGGVRTAKSTGLRNLPSKTWQVNKGWAIAANIAADLAAWTRLLGLHDDPDLREADPDTFRYRIWHIPARLARHARQRTLAISPDWPCKEALTCWHRLCALPAPA